MKYLFNDYANRHFLLCSLQQIIVQKSEQAANILQNADGVIKCWRNHCYYQLQFIICNILAKIPLIIYLEFPECSEFNAFYGKTE